MGRAIIFFRWGIWLRSPKELALLDTHSARGDVLGEVSHSVCSGWVTSWLYTLAIQLPPLGLVSQYGVWTPERVWWLCVAAILGGLVVNVWLHCRESQQKLREVLRSHGIVLCLNCGYDLRGQTGEPVCPECAWVFDKGCSAALGGQ